MPPTLHCGIELLQTADEMLMDTLLADKRTAPYLLKRLSPTVAVIAPETVDKLTAALEKAGHPAAAVPYSQIEDLRNYRDYELGGEWDEEDEDWDDEDGEWDEEDEDRDDEDDE